MTSHDQQLSAGKPAGSPGNEALVEAVEGSPEATRRALGEHGYLADEGLATVIHLAMTLGRPIFLEGEPGAGKTEVAKVLARWTGGRLIRLQCYEGIDAAQAVYDWDYSRQLLHLRSAEVTAGTDGTAGSAGAAGTAVMEDELYSERFLVRRPLLQAIDASSGGGPPPVLLIDEVDRADDEFEALLLEVLDDYTVTVPEVGTFRAKSVPRVVLTSNRTRDVHDALKRRSFYHWVDHPDFAREVAIVAMRAPDIDGRLVLQVAGAVQTMRTMDLYKPPGVAETIDWSMALASLGVTVLDQSIVERTLGTVLKHREDLERVAATGIGRLLDAAASHD